MTLQLIDDGTLDTVIRCNDCGQEFRYGHDFILKLLHYGDNEVTDYIRISQALAFAREDHQDDDCYRQSHYCRMCATIGRQVEGTEKVGDNWYCRQCTGQSI